MYSHHSSAPTSSRREIAGRPKDGYIQSATRLSREGYTMAFHIRNPETDRLARQVARLKGTGLTEAVHTALANELARESTATSLADRIAELSRDLRARSHPERGLPADKAFFDSLSGDD
jgi:antitoxin VapB